MGINENDWTKIGAGYPQSEGLYLVLCMEDDRYWLEAGFFIRDAKSLGKRFGEYIASNPEGAFYMPANKLAPYIYINDKVVAWTKLPDAEDVARTVRMIE